ncbi:sporulation membrane protein YtrI [Bacillus spongiae]|uniref:Sporulation membrane protein YtrI n=1 Tax=Bacillus spongiae TaxID=2683610 RepID=A0ABU8H837_9BACI
MANTGTYFLMRIPPYYRSPLWQKFFSGVVIGGIISWLIFLFMFGTMQEKQSKKIIEQERTIKELEGDIKIWQEDVKKLNELNQDILTVQEVNVTITNGPKYGFINESLTIDQAEQAIKEDLHSLVAKKLETVFESKQVLKKMLENKILKINDKRYRLVIKEIYYFTTIEVFIELRLD